jgi:hypothetical protein
MPLTNREQFLKKNNLDPTKSYSLHELAKMANVPYEALSAVHSRGLGAHSTNSESVRVAGTFKKDPTVPISKKLSAPQWAFARVYAFLNKTKKVYYGSDDDIRRKYNLR